MRAGAAFAYLDTRGEPCGSAAGRPGRYPSAWGRIGTTASPAALAHRAPHRPLRGWRHHARRCRGGQWRRGAARPGIDFFPDLVDRPTGPRRRTADRRVVADGRRSRRGARRGGRGPDRLPVRLSPGRRLGRARVARVRRRGADRLDAFGGRPRPGPLGHGLRRGRQRPEPGRRGVRGLRGRAASGCGSPG